VSSCKARFADTSEKISHRIQFIKAKVEAIKLTTKEDAPSQLMEYLTVQSKGEMDSQSSHSEHEDGAKLPCYYVPFPPNPNFYGREKVLTAVSENLHQNPESPAILSTALWAIAGMGKTQIALEYAHRQQENGIRAIFWIATEDESQSAKCFTEIADLLGLPGATTSRGHDQNRLLVLRWLQVTSESPQSSTAYIAKHA
jgi:hypothetical protein